MDQCQSCAVSSEPLNDLECGHYICQTCLDTATDSRDIESGDQVKVRCPRRGKKGVTCGQLSDVCDIQVLALGSGKEHRAKYDPSVKLMEPELVRMYTKMEREKADQKKIEEMEKEEKKRMEMELNAIKEEEAERLYDTLLRLSEESENCDQICGFRENKTGDKIVLDIQRGSKKEVSTFLEELFKDDLPKIKFDFVEQKCKTSFLLCPGAKIAPARFFENLLVRVTHPDELRDTNHLATVTCLGRAADNKLYVLTIKHVFENGEETKIISSYHSQLTEISDSFKGVLANEKIPSVGGVHLIDIAAMPLKQTIQDELDQTGRDMLFTLNDWYKAPFRRSRQLKDRIVYKYGAVSGTTCGVIRYPVCQIQHRNQDNQVICKGMGFFVESRDPNHPFAVKGDSGALIWDEKGVPIGIVSLAVENYVEENGSVTKHATFGVRLDCCLEVLKAQTGIDVRHCRAVGSPLPLRLRLPDSAIEPAQVDQGAVGGD